MSRVEFRLSMPSTGSWDGRWSGAGRQYVLVRTLPAERAAEIVAGSPYVHRWEDGWVAMVSARLVAPRERVGKSDGFAGYDWMVDNIIAKGTTEL